MNDNEHEQQRRRRRVVRRKIPYIIGLATAAAIVSAAYASTPSIVQAAALQTSASPTTVKKSKKNSSKQAHHKTQTLQGVVVTGSRIRNVNLNFPALQVAVSPQTLQVSNRTNIAAALRALPYVGDGFNSGVGAPADGSSATQINLRGLGTAHTLVLLNGRRFVGGQNLNSVPSILLRRVQVVTGGASAQWGSGAVAGVVNILLKHNVNGINMKLSRGITSYHDGQVTKFAVDGGTSYGGGKGHVMFGFNWLQQQAIGPGLTGRNSIARSRLVALPSGENKILPNIGDAGAAVGGIISSGVLKGFGFKRNGTLRIVSDRKVIEPGVAQGLGAPNILDAPPLIPPMKNYAFLASTHYSIFGNTVFSAQLQHSSTWARFTQLGEPVNGIEISAHNPFLNASIRNILKRNGEQTFTMGTAYQQSISARLRNRRNNYTSLVLKLRGVTPSDWQWSVYASYGLQNVNSQGHGKAVTENWLNALDAVPSPLTGMPICRVALTNPDTSCAPLDLFGEGNASKAAINYVTGTQITNSDNRLGVVSAEMQGSPVMLPAGRLTMAFGADYRYRASSTTVNPTSLVGKFLQFGATPRSGHFNVKEAFGEAFIPLVSHAGGIINNLDVDLAARYSNYSTAGSIWSWKGGLIDEVLPGVRVRADYSQDIRAPNIGELFSPGGSAIFSVADPVTGRTLLVPTSQGGNPNLAPEKAHTLTAGVTWEPAAFPGFSGSVDYYRIRIKDIITTLSSQGIVSGCFDGVTSLCSLITRNSSGKLTRIVANFLNLAEYNESGVDVKLNYDHQATLFGSNGSVYVSVLGTWIHRLNAQNGLSRTQYLNSLGTIHGMPRWKGVGTLGFAGQKFSVHGRVRYISSTDFNANIPIINNHIGNFFYIDAGASYSFSHDMAVYFSVRNLTNKSMPLGFLQAETPWYNLLGRDYTLGVRVHF